MALNKKQSIILLHGTGEFQKFEGMQKGELVIRHAENAADAALYTLLNDGNTLVQFPSKEFVAGQIAEVNGDLEGVHDELTRLNNAITAETSAREEAIQDAKDELNTAIESARTDFNAAIASAKTEWEAADAELEGAIGAVDDKVDKLATTHANDKAELEGKITANANAITAETKAREEADTTLTNDLSALSGTVTNFITEHVGIVDGLNAAISANTKAIQDEVTARTEAVENAKTALNNAITAETKAREEAISAETKAREEAVKGVSDKVDTLIGQDAGKSVRSIASEEVAKVVANAPESLDTLEEIAAWIEAHPESVADLNAKIQANAEAISALTETHNTDKDALSAAISANTEAIASAKTELNNAITAETQARQEAIASAKTELNNAITAETKAREEAVKGVSDRLETVEKSYINEIVATDAAGTSIVSVSEDKHKVTLDFSNFVIDGGTYDGE